MARIVNPHNLDVEDDDALFLGALTDGRIWIEDDDDDNLYVPAFEMIEIETISGVITHTLKGHTNKINSLAISGEFLVSASSDKTLRVWNWKTGQQLAILKGHTDSVNNVVVSGDFVISASVDKTLRVWNWKTGQHLRTFDDFTQEISSIALADQFVFTHSFGTIRVWNWETGELIQKYSAIGDIAIDGDFLLLESGDSLQVMNWKTNQRVRKINFGSYGDDVFLKNNLAISIDEFDGVRVWNWKTGEYFNESEFNTKSRSQIANKVLQKPFDLTIYDSKTNKCYFHFHETIAFADNYSHVITSEESGDIQVAQVAPLLKHLIMGETIAEHRSRGTSHKSENAVEPIPEYDIDAVLEAARDYIRKRDETWVNFSRVSQHLNESFRDLKSKKLGRTDKNYPSLIKLIADYPSDFELRQDPEKQGLYWIRLKTTQSSNLQPGRKIGTKVVREYDTNEVLRTARNFLHGRNEDWANFNHVVLHMYEVFPNINLKHLKLSDKSYKSFLKLLADYPSDFELRQDSEKQGLYWIRLKRTP